MRFLRRPIVERILANGLHRLAPRESETTGRRLERKCYDLRICRTLCSHGKYRYGHAVSQSRLSGTHRATTPAATESRLRRHAKRSTIPGADSSNRAASIIRYDRIVAQQRVAGLFFLAISRVIH